MVLVSPSTQNALICTKSVANSNGSSYSGTTTLCEFTQTSIWLNPRCGIHLPFDKMLCLWDFTYIVALATAAIATAVAAVFAKSVNI